jgi:hydroxymethylpyrimidine kinase/phosphomethylpyrimidine kinase
MGAPVVRPPVALTIAGVDSGGGAGITADLKTFEAHDVWGAVAVTAVTAQNTTTLLSTEMLAPAMVAAQIAAVAQDLGVTAAKTGMLATAATVNEVADTLAQYGIGPIVVDPVMMTGHGDALIDAEGVEAIRDRLLPMAAVVTPNLAEAAALADQAVDDRAGMESAARVIAEQTGAVVLVTGGHLGGERSPDCLMAEGNVRWLEGKRIDAPHHHGSGCVLTAAICAELAHGMEAADACVAAKRFVGRALEAGVALGTGTGPVDPGWERRLGAVGG